MRLLIPALATALLVLILPASIGAQTGSGILDIWLKVGESAEARTIESYADTQSKALVISAAHCSGASPQLSNGIKDAEEVAKALAAQGLELTLKKDLKSEELDRTLERFFIRECEVVDTRFVSFAAARGTAAVRGTTS